eukprot:scaffold9.g3303.t1
MLQLREEVPDFSAETTKGPIESFQSYCKGHWTLLFSHPSDFTPARMRGVPRCARAHACCLRHGAAAASSALALRACDVCTSELGAAAKLQGEFKKRGVQLVALSCNKLESHRQWVKDIEGSMSEGQHIEYPIIADPTRDIATKWGMLDPAEKDKEGRAFAARTAFVIGPDARLRLAILYPSSTGRNFDEILRVIDSLQLAEKHPVATPANWQPGEEVMISPSVDDQKAKELFPDHRVIQVKSGKARQGEGRGARKRARGEGAYIRKTKVPTAEE